MPSPTARVIAAASWLERFLYRRADAVTVLSEDLRDNVAAKLGGHRPDRVHVIPNFVDTERIVAADRENSYRAEYGLSGRRWSCTPATSGCPSRWTWWSRRPAATRTASDVVFVINGGGSALDDLVEQAAGLDNLRFVPMQPRERLPEVLAAADVHLVPLRSGLARSSVPSKLYSILAAGRPVLASVDAGTEVATTIERAGCRGLGPARGRRCVLRRARRLLADPARTAAHRAWPGGFVEGWVSPAAVGAAYERLFGRAGPPVRARRS